MRKTLAILVLLLASCKHEKPELMIKGQCGVTHYRGINADRMTCTYQGIEWLCDVDVTAGADWHCARNGRATAEETKP